MKPLYVPLHITEGEEVVLDCEKNSSKIPKIAICKICIYWIDCKIRKPKSSDNIF